MTEKGPKTLIKSRKELVSQEQTVVQRNNSSVYVILHPAGLSFVNNLMITIKSLRILDLVLPD